MVDRTKGNLLVSFGISTEVAIAMPKISGQVIHEGRAFTGTLRFAAIEVKVINGYFEEFEIEPGIHKVLLIKDPPLGLVPELRLSIPPRVAVTWDDLLSLTKPKTAPIAATQEGVKIPENWFSDDYTEPEPEPKPTLQAPDLFLIDRLTDL